MQCASTNEVILINRYHVYTNGAWTPAYMYITASQMVKGWTSRPLVRKKKCEACHSQHLTQCCPRSHSPTLRNTAACHPISRHGSDARWPAAQSLNAVATCATPTLPMLSDNASTPSNRVSINRLEYRGPLKSRLAGGSVHVKGSSTPRALTPSLTHTS